MSIEKGKVSLTDSLKESEVLDLGLGRQLCLVLDVHAQGPEAGHGGVCFYS